MKHSFWVKPNGRVSSTASICGLLLCILLSSCKELTQPCDCNEAENTATTKVLNDDSFITSDTTSQINETLDYNIDDWAEIKPDDNFVLDLKYASKDNFTKEVIYNCSRCFLRPVAVDKLRAVSQRVKQEKGWRVKLFDCYRPRPAQYKLWELVPDATYVAHPDKGSMHNRGVAVDLSFVDEDGEDIDMGTAFDHFGRESRHTYTDLNDEIISNRKYLKTTMEEAGFNSIKSEWWHYSINGTGSALDDWEWNCE